MIGQENINCDILLGKNTVRFVSSTKQLFVTCVTEGFRKTFIMIHNGLLSKTQNYYSTSLRDSRCRRLKRSV